MACTWEFAANDCVLEVTEQPAGLLDKNFNLSTLTWTEHGPNSIMLKDGDGNMGTYDVTAIPAFATRALFIAFLEPLRDGCAGGGGPISIVPAAQAIAGGSTLSTSIAGSTTSNAESVAMTNVGAANGVWDGVTVPPGFTVVYNAYYDDALQTFFRVRSIPYDATGTTFIISTQL